MKRVFMSLTLALSILNCLAQTRDHEPITIPVIFHVIYSNRSHSPGEGNTSENVETAKLMAELKDLHDDFLLLNRDTSEVISQYKSIIGNPNINFVLADTLLQRGGEKGIIRVYNRNNKKNLHTKSPVINPSKYLNIYIGRMKSSYVNTESWNYPQTDAVYLTFSWVGLKYRLLTHEAGHWLGLLHTFGGSGSGRGGGCGRDGDGISDTPIQKNPTDVECEKCPPLVADNHCDESQPSNYNNFLDYSGCRRMFTVEQCAKMRETITAKRPTLIR